MSPATLTIAVIKGRYAIAMVVGALIVGSTALAQHRPVTNGIALAFPRQESVSAPRSLTEALPYEIRIPVDVTVSEFGKIKSIAFPVAEDSIYRGKFDSLLSAVEFVPGLRKGVPTEQILPIDVVLRPGLGRLGIESSISADSMISTWAAVYARALAANQVTVPEIQTLGAYGFPGIVKSSVVALPIIVAGVTVAPSGRASRVEIVRSTLPSQNDQILALLNWATFSIDKKSPANSADFYVAMVFHPSVSYPTKRITAVARDSNRLARDFLVQTLPDTLGLLLPPLPQLLDCDSISLAEAPKKQYGRVALSVSIDTAGSVTLERISRKELPVRRLADLAMRELKFHPALDFNGRPRNFSGLLYLDFEGSAIVRVQPMWLSDRRFPAIR